MNLKQIEIRIPGTNGDGSAVDMTISASAAPEIIFFSIGGAPLALDLDEAAYLAGVLDLVAGDNPDIDIRIPGETIAPKGDELTAVTVRVARADDVVNLFVGDASPLVLTVAETSDLASVLDLLSDDGERDDADEPAHE